MSEIHRRMLRLLIELILKSGCPMSELTRTIDIAIREITNGW